MSDNFNKILERRKELELKLSSGGLTTEDLAKFSKEYSKLEEPASLISEYLKAKNELSESQEMLKDPDFRAMAEDEIRSLKSKIESLHQKIKIVLLPKDEADDRNVIIEIRAGTGGDEAALFAGDLFHMYEGYAAQKGWKISVLSANESDLKGYKEISFQITGQGVYARMKFESGTHRVQRVPETESGGRIHTSAATVAVMPEAQEVDININPADLRIDTFRASGAGGQHVNKTESAVRITHIPTNTISQCQDQSSQHKNKAQAMKMLLARIYDKIRDEQAKERSDLRKVQVGSGDRSERIRTYNYPQSRVSDHRINLTLYKLDTIMTGEGLDEIIESLIQDHQVKLLASVADV
ncbi:MAG: peptide chain release factor 1 [Alphaproteobacteria bacterium]|nr:peptide chain release factor 1 [Alphaproteobacteria bacterium]MBN2780153.1 peptide chain release factor 1 [Alphaproteobacteria bacterium]